VPVTSNNKTVCHFFFSGAILGRTTLNYRIDGTMTTSTSILTRFDEQTLSMSALYQTR